MKNAFFLNFYRLSDAMCPTPCSNFAADFLSRDKNHSNDYYKTARL